MKKKITKIIKETGYFYNEATDQIIELILKELPGRKRRSKESEILNPVICGYIDGWNAYREEIKSKLL